jgi:hypothetical protein
MATASSICQQARQIAKCPGWTIQSGQKLQQVLENLAQSYDLPSARQTLQNFIIGPNAGNGYNNQFYILPLPDGASYLRTKEVFYNVDGTIFYPNQIPLEQYDKLFQGLGISNYPYNYTVNVEPTLPRGYPQMAFYPPPNLSLSLTIRLQYQPIDIVSPEAALDIPWFPNTKYLVTETAAELMKITGDNRQSQFSSDALGILTAYTKMVDDKENYAQRVKLDPSMFRSVSDLKPTKTTGF